MFPTTMRCNPISFVTLNSIFFNVLDPQKGVFPSLVRHLWADIILKDLVVSDNCKVSAASWRPTLVRLEHTAVFACVPLK